MKWPEETIPPRSVWCMDDNVAVQDRGWIIYGDPPDLFDIKKHSRFLGNEPTIFRTEIKPKLLEDPLMTKAYVTLMKAKLDNPEHKFRFDGEAYAQPKNNNHKTSK